RNRRHGTHSEERGANGAALTRAQSSGEKQTDARRQRRTRDDDERERRQIECDGLHELHDDAAVQRPCCDDSSSAVEPHGSIPASTRVQKGRRYMLNYALVFLLVGLIAGALGMFGVAAVATQIAW